MPKVWGILNVTPDSFSDGGEWLDPRAAIERAKAMLAEGADVIDVGGASSRPAGATYGLGAAPVPVEEELRRVVPVLEGIFASLPHAVVSIDTTRGLVASEALRRGARIVNDVSMGRDPTLVAACAEHGAELVLMHTRGDGRIDPSSTRYGDVVEDVLGELLGAVERAEALGVPRDRVWIDPGLGFAKTAGQSMALLSAIDRFVDSGLRVLVGASRKSFLAEHAADPGSGGRPAPAERLGASVAAATLAAWAGAHGVRVHDVRASRQAVCIAAYARSKASARSCGNEPRVEGP